MTLAILTNSRPVFHGSKTYSYLRPSTSRCNHQLRVSEPYGTDSARAYRTAHGCPGLQGRAESDRIRHLKKGENAGGFKPGVRAGAGSMESVLACRTRSRSQRRHVVLQSSCPRTQLPTRRSCNGVRKVYLRRLESALQLRPVTAPETSYENHKVSVRSC